MRREKTFQLFKWGFAVQRTRGSDWETYSVQEIVSVQLLALIEEQAVHRFLAFSANIGDVQEALMASDDSPHGLLVRKHPADNVTSSGYSRQT